jgi:F0F1-type ATP synthase membrane subunit c/vacuolar-type H+-ATPase subunit K
MIELSECIHFGTIAGIVGLSSFSAGIGQGLTGRSAIKAMDIQPQARCEIGRAATMGMALIDTASILCLTVSFMMIFGTHSVAEALYTNIADLGILLALSLPAFAIGIISSLPSSASCMSIARQPFFAEKISRFMLISQSVIQTPIIFGFIVALLIKTGAYACNDIVDSIRLVATGAAVGASSLGPIIGLGTFAKSACYGIGVNREAYPSLLTLTFISNAIIETPIVLSLVIAFVIFGTTIIPGNALDGIRLVSAATCIGIGTFGPGISSGRTSARACTYIAQSPSNYGTLSKVSLFAQGLIDTCAIYAFLISLMMVLVVK